MTIETFIMENEINIGIYFDLHTRRYHMQRQVIYN